MGKFFFNYQILNLQTINIRVPCQSQIRVILQQDLYLRFIRCLCIQNSEMIKDGGIFIQTHRIHDCYLHSHIEMQCR